MNLVRNEPLIKRNAAIGKYATIAGLVVLVAGLIVSFTRPEWPLVPFYTLIVGFVLSNVGIFFSNRYLRRPRPDQAMEGALKGLDDKYRLYQYYLPASHVLVCPAGLLVLVPKFQAGSVRWEGRRWRHGGGNILLGLFGQEGLGNPNAEAASQAESLSQFLAKKLGDDVPPAQPIIVFYNPKAVIEAKDAPLPALHAKQLKEYVRRLPKGPTLSPAQIAQLDEAIGV